MTKNESFQNVVAKSSLSKMIEQNFETLGFVSDQNKEVIRYFLRKNINALFGSDTFNEEETKISFIEADTLEERTTGNVLKINYGGVEYIVSSENGQLKMVNPNTPMMFKISVEKNVYHNLLVTIVNEDCVCDYQTVGLEENPYFAYQKVMYSLDGEETITQALRAQSIKARRGYDSLFQIVNIEDIAMESPKKETNQTGLKIVLANFKKYLVNLKSNSEIIGLTFLEEPFDLCKHLDEIFYMLEKKVEGKTHIRIRKP